MGNIVLAPYKSGSNSGKVLADNLGIKRLKVEGSKFNPKKGDMIINWGRSQLEGNCMNSPAVIFNHPNEVAMATNKLKFFEKFDVLGLTPRYTRETRTAMDWLQMGGIVVERHVLSGHSGAGIRIVSKAGDLQDAPLYTRYIKKREEYRIHLAKFYDHESNQTEIWAFDVQRKARKLDVPDDDVDWQVRNLEGGFIYARNEGLELSNTIKNVAVKAFKWSGLTFGAVDIIVTARGKPYVLEINTAPGLSGSTIDSYTNMFKVLIDSQQKSFGNQEEFVDTERENLGEKISGTFSNLEAQIEGSGAYEMHFYEQRNRMRIRRPQANPAPHWGAINLDGE